MSDKLINNKELMKGRGRGKYMYKDYLREEGRKFFIEKLNKTSAFSVVETWKREVRKLNGNSEKSHSESFRHE